MINTILSYYHTDVALAFFCLITAAMGAFLGANQVRIEREDKYNYLGLKAEIDAILKANERHFHITQSHTKLIHDLTPKNRKRK